MKLNLLFVLCLFSMGLRAQTSPGIKTGLRGLLLDSISQKTMDYATVALKDEKNNHIKSVISEADGSFTISGIKPGSYMLNVVSMGYRTKTLKADVSGKAGLTDIGTILISPVSNQLKEVVVIADKPIIRQEVDKLVYDLQADPESKSSNVLEMMRKVPLLSVDGDDNILLKGDANYKILINGKPSSMMERNAKNVLKSMPASSIQDIEVITNPAARYDAEGMAGIINIITNKKVDNGYNASLNLSHRFPNGGPGTGGSATFKQGKLGVSAYWGANLSETPATRNNLFRNTSGTNETALRQLGTLQSERQNAYLGTELSFEIDSLNLISGQFNINGNKNESLNYQNSVLTSDGGVLQSYDLQGDNEGDGEGMDAALNYQLGFRSSKKRLLTFSYRYYDYTNRQRNRLTSSDVFNYELPDYRQSNMGGSAEQTFQADYVHPVGKLSIEGGIKGIRRKNDSDYQVLSLNSGSGAFEPDPARTNVFHNTQDVLGAYNTYQYNLTNWGFKAGFRLEQTIIDADFISGQAQVRQEYLNLIPSVNVNRKFKDMSSLNLGFSQRIQRPGIYQLNPFIDRSNPNVESTGNPDLHPTVGSSLELGYSKSKKGSLNLILGYRYFEDLIMPVSVFDPLTYITRNSYDNTGRARLFTLNANINYPVTKEINFSFNGGLAHGRVRGIINNILVKNEGFMYHFSSSASYRLEKGWRLNASVNVNGPNLSLQGTSNSYIGSAFSVNKDLIKDKLSFSAAANNPFSKYRMNIRESFGPDFFQSMDNQTFYRNFNTSLNYRFGKLKGGIKKNVRGIRNDDVSNSPAQ